MKIFIVNLINFFIQKPKFKKLSYDEVLNLLNSDSIINDNQFQNKVLNYFNLLIKEPGAVRKQLHNLYIK